MKHIISFLFLLLMAVFSQTQAGGVGSKEKAVEEDGTEPPRNRRVVEAEASPLYQLTRPPSPIAIRRGYEPQVTLSKGSWFFHLVNDSDFPIIGKGLMSAPIGIGGSITPRGGLLSEVWHDEPLILSNASIFPYLIGYGNARRHPKLCEFIRKYYKTSCALVYYPDRGDPKIIGTGSFLENGRVATARHNFNGIDLSKLYIRFFDYIVSRIDNPRYLHVAENYIDVPLIKALIAKGGLDAGYLEMHPVNAEISHRFMRPLPITAGEYRDEFTTLVPGRYAMFHFAGGKHLISAGQVEDPAVGAALYNNISIEAGPGASGAAIIQRNLGLASSHGISVYRNVFSDMGSPYVARRVIPFERFSRPETVDDPISAPYLGNPGFFIVPPIALEQSGYEFLLWDLSLHTPKSRRVEHPGGYGEIYSTAPNHDVHHIIPIIDLLFLWDYLNNGDPRRYDFLGYEVFGGVIRSLCPPMLASPGKLWVDHGNIRNNFTRRHFAWPWWNLFKGWADDFREGDPRFGDSIGDYSEKIMPLKFSPILWKSVKELYGAIQELKRPTYRTKHKHLSLLQKLTNVREVWLGMHERTMRGFTQTGFPKIYEFRESDWDRVGYRMHPKIGNHAVYQLKSS